MEETKKQFWIKYDKEENRDNKIKLLKSIPQLQFTDEKNNILFLDHENLSYIIDEAIKNAQQVNFY